MFPFLSFDHIGWIWHAKSVKWSISTWNQQLEMLKTSSFGPYLVHSRVVCGTFCIAWRQSGVTMLFYRKMCGVTRAPSVPKERSALPGGCILPLGKCPQNPKTSMELKKEILKILEMVWRFTWCWQFWKWCTDGFRIPGWNMHKNSPKILSKW